MPVLSLDARRRVTLPKEIVEDEKHRFVAIRTREGILLKILPRDPVVALQMEGKKLKGISVKRLRRIATQAAIREVSR